MKRQKPECQSNVMRAHRYALKKMGLENSCFDRELLPFETMLVQLGAVAGRDREREVWNPFTISKDPYEWTLS